MEADGPQWLVILVTLVSTLGVTGGVRLVWGYWSAGRERASVHSRSDNEQLIKTLRDQLKKQEDANRELRENYAKFDARLAALTTRSHQLELEKARTELMLEYEERQTKENNERIAELLTMIDALKKDQK